MKKITFILFLSATLSISLTNFACERELTGDESRDVLLRHALTTCKGPCWPQTCAARYPNCPLSRERRSYNVIMAKLTEQIGPRYSAKNKIKEQCLACYTDTCSHPFCALGTAASATTLTILEALGSLDGAGCWPTKLLTICGLVAAPTCSGCIDYFCRGCLTDPSQWDHDTDTEMQPAIMPAIDHLYDVTYDDALKNMPNDFEDFS